MDDIELGYLTLVVVSFVAFAATLFYQSIRSGGRR